MSSKTFAMSPIGAIGRRRRATGRRRSRGAVVNRRMRLPHGRHGQSLSWRGSPHGGRAVVAWRGCRTAGSPALVASRHRRARWLFLVFCRSAAARPPWAAAACELGLLRAPPESAGQVQPMTSSRPVAAGEHGHGLGDPCCMAGRGATTLRVPDLVHRDEVRIRPSSVLRLVQMRARSRSCSTSRRKDGNDLVASPGSGSDRAEGTRGFARLRRTVRRGRLPRAHRLGISLGKRPAASLVLECR